MSQQEQGTAGDPDSEPDRESLQRIIMELREENAFLRKSLGSLLADPVEFDKQAILKEFGKEPSIAQLVAEMNNAGEVANRAADLG